MPKRTLKTADPSCEGVASEILSLWQSRAAHPLGESDARQIVTNLTGFFEVLLDWQSQERAETGLVKIEG